MRKLNTKNKTIITCLLCIISLIFILIGIFIIYKYKDMSIKYEVLADSYTYDKSNILIKIEFPSYVKKDFNGNYILYTNNEKHNLSKTNVIYQKSNNTLILLGKFYEILNHGDISKDNGITIIDTTASKFYKLADRKYLFVSSEIASTNNALMAKDYLLVNIDKKGNSYLYNNEINTKTFTELTLNSKEYSFNVNEEKLTINNEVISLDKINGSTNEYQKPEEENNNNNTTISNTVYPEPKVIVDKVIKNEYIQHKTTIVGYTASEDKVKIDYVAYDPLTEYTSLYIKLYKENVYQKQVNLNVKDTVVTLEGLSPQTEYKAQFYYTYLNDNDVQEEVLFDTLYFTTSNVTGDITLEKVSNDGVVFKVVINNKALLNSATVIAYDGLNNVIGQTNIDPSQAISGGYLGTIKYNKQPEGFVILKLKNCIYNGANINVNASYKYKI